MHSAEQFWFLFWPQLLLHLLCNCTAPLRRTCHGAACRRCFCLSLYSLRIPESSGLRKEAVESSIAPQSHSLEHPLLCAPWVFWAASGPALPALLPPVWVASDLGRSVLEQMNVVGERAAAWYWISLSCPFSQRRISQKVTNTFTFFFSTFFFFFSCYGTDNLCGELMYYLRIQ